MKRVGVVEAALGEQLQLLALAALFPNTDFQPVPIAWPERSAGGLDVLITAVDGASAIEVDTAARRLRAYPADLRVVVLLKHADIATTRLLLREGAADVLTAPVNETTLAVTLDKLLGPQGAPSSHRKGGQIVAVIKAGGGVGATALATQAGAIAAQAGAAVCLADLDLQFGAASIYLDMPDAATVSDCMSGGASLAEVDFGSLLGKHRSGLSLMAAPRQVTPLEALAPAQTAALLNALKLSFELSVVDLPSVWTAWTNRALQLADRIVIVTHLSVPHMHMLDRQIATLRAQGLDDRPLTLVCNALAPEQTATLPLKSAERALGRSFDVVVPEDRKLMYAAINQGVPLSAIRRGTKIEKAVGELAQVLAPQAAAQSSKPRRWG